MDILYIIYLLSLLLTCPSYHPNESKRFVDYLALMGFVLSVCCLIGQTPQDRLGYMAIGHVSKTQHHNRIDKMHI